MLISTTLTITKMCVILRHPFGMQMHNRTATIGGKVYRFAFNGQEKDDEVAGAGNSMTAEFWQYDSRLGRRWNVDPRPHVSVSAYSCFYNCPVLITDIKGDTGEVHARNRQEAGMILANIMIGFEVTFEEEWTENEDGSIDIKIWDAKSFDTDGSHKVLQPYISEVLNSDQTVDFMFEPDDPNNSDKTEVAGGMRTHISDDGKVTIYLAEKWITGNWGRDLYRPRYEYLLREANSGDKVAYFLTGNRAYAKRKRREIPFDEGLAHEIIHASRALTGAFVVGGDQINEENVTREVMNQWRKGMGFPPRGYEVWSSYLGVLGAAFRYEALYYDEYDYDY